MNITIWEKKIIRQDCEFQVLTISDFFFFFLTISDYVISQQEIKVYDDRVYRSLFILTTVSFK